MTKLVTFADGKGQRAGALLDGGRVLDLGSAVLGPLAAQAGDMLTLIEAGPAALAAVRALAAEPPPAAVLDAGARGCSRPSPALAATSSASAATTWTTSRKGTAPAASRSPSCRSTRSSSPRPRTA
jgi:hypothetical protein